MKRLLIIIATMSLFVIGATAATALADKPPTPPGQDPCSHGNTGKPCRPDPSPNGKDCDHHGNKGGVNEDHCLGETTTTTTTTTQPPTTTTQTTTTQPPSTTTTQTTTTQTPATTQTTTTTPPITTTTTTPNAPPAVVPPKAKPPIVTKKKLETDLDKQAEQNGATPTAAKQTPGELPNTGLPLGLVALLGAALTAAGLVLRRVG